MIYEWNVCGMCGLFTTYNNYEPKLLFVDVPKWKMRLMFADGGRIS